MKKFTALLLTAAMLLTMAACAAEPEPPVTTGQPTTEPSTQPTTQPTEPPETEPAPTEYFMFQREACQPLFGTWQYTVTLDKDLQNMTDFEKSVSFQMYYTFNEDSTFAARVDEDAFRTAISEFEEALLEYMMDRGYTSFRADLRRIGYSVERIDQLWADGEEAKVRKNAETTIAALGLGRQCSQLIRSGYYYVVEGRVYTSLNEQAFEASTFTVEDGTLTLLDTDNPLVYRPLRINFPLTLTKA